MRTRRSLAAGLALVAWAAAAEAADIKSWIRKLYPIPSVTGNEEFLAAGIAGLLPKSLALETDNLGGLAARWGSGGPTVLVPLDEFGYVVSGFTTDGFLTLDRPVPLPVPIHDSFLLGHAVVLTTRSGPVNGVVAQPAMHLLTRERRDLLARDLTLDMIFVDIGARSEAEARSRGVEILDPVTFRADLIELAGLRWAGPGLGRKAAAAALGEAASELSLLKPPPPAEFVWMAQTRFPARGSRWPLGAARAKAARAPKTAILLDAVAADRGGKSPAFGRGLAVIQAREGPSALRDSVEAAARRRGLALQFRLDPEAALLAPFAADGGEALILALPAKYAGTPGETIALADVEALAALLSEYLGSRRAP